MRLASFPSRRRVANRGGGEYAGAAADGPALATLHGKAAHPRGDRRYARGLQGTRIEGVVVSSMKGTLTGLGLLQLGRKVLNVAAAAIKPGITTDEIDAIVHAECLKRDAYREYLRTDFVASSAEVHSLHSESAELPQLPQECLHEC